MGYGIEAVRKHGFIECSLQNCTFNMLHFHLLYALFTKCMGLACVVSLFYAHFEVWICVVLESKFRCYIRSFGRWFEISRNAVERIRFKMIKNFTIKISFLVMWKLDVKRKQSVASFEQRKLIFINHHWLFNQKQLDRVIVIKYIFLFLFLLNFLIYVQILLNSYHMWWKKNLLDE